MTMEIEVYNGHQLSAVEQPQRLVGVRHRADR